MPDLSGLNSQIRQSVMASLGRAGLSQPSGPSPSAAPARPPPAPRSRHRSHRPASDAPQATGLSGIPGLAGVPGLSNIPGLSGIQMPDLNNLGTNINEMVQGIMGTVFKPDGTVNQNIDHQRIGQIVNKSLAMMNIPGYGGRQPAGRHETPEDSFGSESEESSGFSSSTFSDTDTSTD